MMNTATISELATPASMSARPLIPTSNLPLFVREATEAHRDYQLNAKGMLFAAKRAGEALLKAKEEGKRTGEIPHGQFKAWVEVNTRIPYRTAARYMQVAKSVDIDTFDPAASIESLLATKGKPKAKPAFGSFTKEDADYALKLYRLAEDHCNENESAVARAKLDNLAANHGMTREEILDKTRSVLGLNQEFRDPDEFKDLFEKGMDRLFAPFKKMKREELLNVMLYLVVKNPDNIGLLVDYKK